VEHPGEDELEKVERLDHITIGESLLNSAFDTVW
jgi:hypothetical protein